MHQQVFYLAYHLHWGRDEVLSLATDERRTYLRLLQEQLEREQESVAEAQRKSRA